MVDLAKSFFNENRNIPCKHSCVTSRCAYVALVVVVLVLLVCLLYMSITKYEVRQNIKFYILSNFIFCQDKI